ncbi:MAG: gliding motility-associated C-terminal domain-containing protein [Chitinophagaceae bacterium]
MYKSLIIYLILILQCFVFKQTTAQSNCPPNIDFETGTLSNWQFYIGVCCPISGKLPSQAINGRHTLMSGTALDYFGGFPVLPPGGGQYALKLGNSSAGSQSESAEYSFIVPNSINNYSIIYRYAVVFEDPNHSLAEQPRFVVSAFDSTSNQIVNCNDFLYISGGVLPGFEHSLVDNSVLYKSWTTSTLNLSGLAGHKITITFESGDCSLGAHFGYGYVDVSCGLFQINGVICNNEPNFTMSGPSGFENYLWYDSSLTTLLAQGEQVTLNSPSQNTTYKLVIIPYVGFGCPDTLTTTIYTSNSTTSTLYNTICQGESYEGYTTTGIYIDTLTNIAGCDSIRTINLKVNPTYYLDTIITKCFDETILYDGISYSNPVTTNIFHTTTLGCDSITHLEIRNTPTIPLDLGPDRKICKGDYIIYNSLPFVSFLWNTGDTTANIEVQKTGTYTLQATDQYGCIYIDQVAIEMIPKPNIRIFTSEKAICKNQEIVLSAFGGSNYIWYLNDTSNSLHYGDTLHANIKENTNIILCGEGTNSCSNYDTVSVYIVSCCDNIILPNAFTPNGDGINDIFKPIGLLKYDQYELKIMNRWGNEVFHSNAQEIGWEGNHKGVPCIMDTYYYFLKVKCKTKEELIKGDVLLMR